VREKLIVFPYAEYIVGIYLSLTFKARVKFEDDIGVCEKFAKI